MSCTWYSAFLMGSPDRASGIIAGARARVVLATLLRSDLKVFGGGLDKIAEQVGLKKTYFRNGIDDLVQIEWIKKVASDREGQVGHFSIADIFLSECTKKVPSQYEALAEKVLFSMKGRIAPNHQNILLAVLALSSDEYGFITTLSRSDLADRSGIKLSTMTGLLRSLQKQKKIAVFKGASGMIFEGKGWKPNSVYQINPKLLNYHSALGHDFEVRYLDFINMRTTQELMKDLNSSLYFSSDLKRLLDSIRPLISEKMVTSELCFNLAARSLPLAGFLINNISFRENFSFDPKRYQRYFDLNNTTDIFYILIQSNPLGLECHSGLSSASLCGYFENAIHQKKLDVLLSFIIYVSAIHVACCCIDHLYLCNYELKSQEITYAIHCHQNLNPYPSIDKVFYAPPTLQVFCIK